jgi:quercetin dioxygenase-like cupin family protein
MSCKTCQNCDQPPDDREWSADGVFVKQMFIAKADTAIPQHAHAYDHLSMLARGSVKIWKDGVYDRWESAPAAIFIKAGVKHAFVSLEDNTIIYCIHREREGGVKIMAEHQIGDFS